MMPVSEQVNLLTENMIAASNGLNIHPGETEQWSERKQGWDSEDWTDVED